MRKFLRSHLYMWAFAPLLFISLLISTSCQDALGSSPREIVGSVVDAATGEPIPNLPVGLMAWEVARRFTPSEPLYPDEQTRTNNFGKFSFYLTPKLKKKAPFLLFTLDELYENQAFKDAVFSGKYPTRKEIEGKALPFRPEASSEVVFKLALGLRVEDPVFIPMRDGAKLAAVMYLPKEEGRYPVILLRTPYGRHGNREYASVAREGYVIVSQDLRGRGDSEGENMAFINDAWGELQDGYDTVEWLAKQPFCNGQVATAGGSALGITQELLAGTYPPSLKAQVIAVAVPSLYHYAAYPGGIYRKEQVDGWLEENKFDEKNLILMHEHPFYDEFWAHLDLSTRIEEVNTPALLIGGWYDTFAEGTIASFKLRTTRASTRARENTWLVMGPWVHGNIFGEYVGEIRFPPQAGRSFFGEVLSFLNYYLKGIEGVFPDKVPKVQYYVMGDLSDPDAPGNFWMSASDFPPEAELAKFYLTDEGKLSPNFPTKEDIHTKILFNPTEPVPTKGGRNLNIPAGPMDQKPVEERSDVIFFTSDLITKPLPIVGLVRAVLYVATEGKDADISVRLSDVYPDGTSFLLLDSSARLSLPPPYLARRSVVPAKFYELTIDLGHTAYIFNRGHRLRVAIACSNYPRYEVNSLASPENEPINVFISLGKDMPSTITLPIYEYVLEKFQELRSKGDERKH